MPDILTEMPDILAGPVLDAGIRRTLFLDPDADLGDPVLEAHE